MTEQAGDNMPPRTVGELIEAARQGRSEVLPALRLVLDRSPQLWQEYGNLACQAQAHWLELIGGQDLYFQEAMGRHAATLRAELAGADATPLEKLQVERIVALNLQVGYLETLVAKNEATASEKILTYLHERCAVADRRLQQAMIGLARIRRLLPGVLKIDVVISGEVQANINEPGDKRSEDSGGTTRIQVPQNRLKDILAAANN